MASQLALDYGAQRVRLMEFDGSARRLRVLKVVDVDLRVGDYQLDNTHQLRGQAGGSDRFTMIPIPLDDDPDAVRAILWYQTDARYKRARERLIFGLRRLEGVDQPAFAAATGFEVSTLGGAALQRFLDGGLLEQAGTRLRLTRDGLLLSDSLWPELL